MGPNYFYHILQVHIPEESYKYDLGLHQVAMCLSGVGFCDYSTQFV